MSWSAVSAVGCRIVAVEIWATSRPGLVTRASYRQARAPCAQETLRVALASDRPCQVPKATVYQWGAAGEGPPECGLLSGCAFRSDIMAWLRHAEIDLKNGG